MSWTSFTGNNADGSQQFLDAIETQLTAHPAWEFVEETTEYYDEAVTGGTYHAQTFTIRVWKNLGTLNRLGEDFYVALVTVERFAPTGTDPAVGFASDEGKVGIFAFEGWDAAQKRVIRPVGHAIRFDNPPFTLDPTTKSMRGDLAFPLFQSMISADGLFWGSWGSWPKPISSVPANLNNNDFNMATGYGIMYGAYTYEDPAQTDSDGTTTLWMRVTNDGILTLAYEVGMFGGYSYQAYVGLGDDSDRPEGLRSPFPLICTFALGQGSGVGVDAAQSRYPEAGQTVITEPLRTDMGVYDSSLAPLPDATDRSGWPYPNLAPYVFVRSNLQSYGAPIMPRDEGVNYHDPGIAIPGLYVVSVRGAGHFQQFDTILSPEGKVCVVVADAYFGSEGTSAAWNAIDTELE